MTNKIRPQIQFEGQTWTFEDLYITELGFLYLKLKNEDENRWVNFRISNENYDPGNNFLVDLLKNNN